MALQAYRRLFSLLGPSGFEPWSPHAIGSIPLLHELLFPSNSIQQQLRLQGLSRGLEMILSTEFVSEVPWNCCFLTDFSWPLLSFLRTRVSSFIATCPGLNTILERHMLINLGIKFSSFQGTEV